MACIHGLPGWCLTCAGVKMPEKPEFRRRMPEPEIIRYGASIPNMGKCAASQSRIGRLDIARSDWRYERKIADIAEFCKDSNVTPIDLVRAFMGKKD
jgi:hypothetical protein